MKNSWIKSLLKLEGWIVAFKIVILFEYSSQTAAMASSSRAAEETTAWKEKLRKGTAFTWFQPGLH